MAYKATVTELTEEQWDRQIAVNLKSVYLYSNRIIPIMEKQGGGAIINMGSVTSLVGVPILPLLCVKSGNAWVDESDGTGPCRQRNQS